MKKKLYIIAVVCLAVALWGCGNKNIDVSPNSEEVEEAIPATENKDKKEKESVDNPDKSENGSKGTGNEEARSKGTGNEEAGNKVTDNGEGGNKETKVKKAPGDLVQKFMLGKLTATVAEGKLLENTNSGFKSVETVDRDSLLAHLALTEDFYCESLAYGPLEVTNNPGDWFCMTVVLINENDSCPETEYVIWCETEDELIFKGFVEDYYRVSAAVYSNGEATYGGSAGAGEHIFSYYGIDSKGDFREICTETGCYSGWDHFEYYSEDEYTSDLPVNTLMRKFGEQATDRMYDSLCMMQVRIGYDYYYWPEIDDYEKTEELVNSLSKELGVEFTPYEEVMRLEKEAFENEGINHHELRDTDYVEMIYTIKFKND